MKKTIVILILLFPSVLISQDLKYFFSAELEENIIIPERRIALIIANTNYNNNRLDLKNPINDANLIAQTLDSLDFEVIFKEDQITT